MTYYTFEIILTSVTLCADCYVGGASVSQRSPAWYSRPHHSRHRQHEGQVGVRAHLQYPLIVDLLQKAKAAGLRMIARILIVERGAVTDGGAQS